MTESSEALGNVHVGTSAVELFAAIVAANPAIESVVLIHYEPTLPLVSRTALHPDELQVFVSKRDGGTRPVWVPDYEVLYGHLIAGGEVPREMLRKAAEHRGTPATRKRTSLPRADVSAHSVLGLRERYEGWALAAASRVRTASGERHLPMVDFQCPIGSIYQQTLVEGLTALGCREGALVESGKSYHYYGYRLLSRAEWRRFIGFFLLLSPFIDTRYVGHRLIDGESVLRLTADPVKPVEPKVVALLGQP
jgi:hypothetical protein